jgi:hypothetical protein
MDLKALIAKMDKIESNQLLNEGFPTVADAKARADKEKTTGKFDKKEIKPGVTQYTRKSSTFDDGGKDSDQKKAEKKTKNEDIKFNSSIARGLIEEFGYEIEEDNVEEATSPWANDPAKDAAWKALSPEDQKWLGGADPTDKFILARAPNKGKPAAPTAAAPAAAPAAAEPAASAAAEPAAPTIDPAKLKRFKELLAKASAPAAPAAKPATESVTYEDDQTLLAIKNIRF